MPSLRELESSFAAWILHGAPAPELLDLVAGDGWPIEERLALHRNNVFASLTKALAATFPVTARLVGEGFFAYAAHEFIATQPPRTACLASYGADLPDFLAGFAPCRPLVYLPDVARLEWLMHCAAHAAALPALPPAALAGIAEEETPRLVFRLQPAIAYLRSPFPIDRIWAANHGGAAEESIALDEGEALLEVGRAGDDVVYRRLDGPSFLFRTSLAAGASLAQAAEAALGEDPAFDLAQALPALFQQGAITTVTLATDTDQERTS